MITNAFLVWPIGLGASLIIGGMALAVLGADGYDGPPDTKREAETRAVIEAWGGPVVLGAVFAAVGAAAVIGSVVWYVRG